MQEGGGPSRSWQDRELCGARAARSQVNDPGSLPARDSPPSPRPRRAASHLRWNCVVLLAPPPLVSGYRRQAACGRGSAAATRFRARGSIGSWVVPVRARASSRFDARRVECVDCLLVLVSRARVRV